MVNHFKISKLFRYIDLYCQQTYSGVGALSKKYQLVDSLLYCYISSIKFNSEKYVFLNQITTAFGALNRCQTFTNHCYRYVDKIATKMVNCCHVSSYSNFSNKKC